MTHIIHTQADLETAVHVLIKQDPRWQPVFAKSGMPAIRRREGGYAGLCSIVCGQQVSTASAAAIRARLFAAFEPFHHDTVRLARGDKLARLGLSRPKIKSIKAIGKAIARKHIDLDAVGAMEAAQGQEAARLAFGHRKRPDAKAMTKLGEKWRPWRGVAAHLLWAYYHAVKRREGAPVQATWPAVTKKQKAKKETKKENGAADGQ